MKHDLNNTKTKTLHLKICSLDPKSIFNGCKVLQSQNQKLAELCETLSLSWSNRLTLRLILVRHLLTLVDTKKKKKNKINVVRVAGRSEIHATHPTLRLALLNSCIFEFAVSTCVRKYRLLIVYDHFEKVRASFKHS